jgi:chromosome partitioning protein
LRHAQTVRKGHPKAVCVLSMVNERYRLTKDMKEAAAALRLPLAKNSLCLRQIYADAPGQGAIVWHMGTRGRDAGKEVRAFFRELLPHAIKSKTNLRQMKKAAG